MEAIDNDMTQQKFSEIMARITELQLLELMGEDHQEELNILKKKIEYEEY